MFGLGKYKDFFSEIQIFFNRFFRYNLLYKPHTFIELQYFSLLRNLVSVYEYRNGVGWMGVILQEN